MKNNYSKIIRSNNDYYNLPKQEIVCSFRIGSSIFTRNLENKFGSFTRNIQSKVLEQKKQWIQLGSSIDAPSDVDPYGINEVSFNASGTVLATITVFGGGQSRGQTRVHVWNGSSWIQRGSTIYGENAQDFTERVSLNSSGNVLAIGSRSNDGNGTNSGHVRIYAWNGASWVQRGNDIDGENSGDRLGDSVDLNASGDVIAIKSSRNSGNRVRVYAWNGSSWVKRGTDLLNGTNQIISIGKNVSLDETGNILAAVSGLSSVNIYEWNGSSWSLLWTKQEDVSHIMGISLSKDGKTLAVGMDRANDTSIVKIYRRSGSSWIQLGLGTEGEYPSFTTVNGVTAPNDNHGASVSLNYSGNILAVGAPWHSISGYQKGMVKVYRWNGLSWVQKGTAMTGKNYSYDNFGDSVSLNQFGDKLAIAASRAGSPPFSDLPIGYANVYSWE